MNHKFETTKSTIGNKKPQIPLGYASWILCLFYPFMQNKTNLNNRATIDERRETKKCKTNPISTTRHRPNTQTVTILHHTFTNFALILPKNTQKRANFYSEIHKKRELLPNFYAKRIQFSFTNPEPNVVHGQPATKNMQNEPNLQTSSHKCLRTKDIRKYLPTALLVSTNNQ